jgi:subtilisin family serine protease
VQSTSLPAVLLVAALVALPALAGALPSLQEERVLVSLDGPAEPLLHAAVEALGGRVLEDFAFIHVSLVALPSAALPAIRTVPGVANLYAEEPLTALLSSSRPAVHVGPMLWDAGIDGAGVAVAVVDSGIDESHPGLVGRVREAVRVTASGIEASSGDRDGHGTHIAGIIAGDGTQSPDRSNAGMAPKADLVAVDISDSFTTTNAVRAFGWLRDHAASLGLRVVSSSWGREKPDAAYDANDPVIRASDALVDAGIVVVFSAGNLGPGEGSLTVEAQNPRVITVGAASDDARLESYSSRGPAKLADGRTAGWTKPDVLAPGTRITSAHAGGGDPYIEMNGTSMAAPHVAGIAALLLSAAPQLTPAEVHGLLLTTARDVGAPGLDTDSGAGFVDGLAAVQAARELVGAPAEPDREPFAREGQVAPAAGLLPASLLAEPSQAASEVRVPVAVPPGALGLEFTVRWDDPRSSFEVWLERGGDRLGPFRGAVERAGWMELHVQVQDGLQPGAWEIVARSHGPSVQVQYRVEGAVLVLTSHGARAGLLPGSAGPLSPLVHEGSAAAQFAAGALLALPIAAGLAWAQRPRRALRPAGAAGAPVLASARVRPAPSRPGPALGPR